MGAPCWHCMDRTYWCHGMCKDYMAFKAANDLLKAKKHQHYNKNGILIESVQRHKERNRNPNRMYKTHMK